MTWVAALSLLAIALFAVCVAIVAYAQFRAKVRAIRVSNREVYRERVTITLPSFALRDFHERNYHD